MAERIPIFPLATVVFPGVTLPLHVFEDRYRTLVQHLLAIGESSARLFGIVAIREGYEVGRPHPKSVQSVQRIGCVVQLVSAERYLDGRYDIEVVGRTRLRLDSLDTSADYLVGEVARLDDPADVLPATAAEAVRALETFEEYRRRLSRMRGTDVLEGALPRDPTYLSYSLSATCLLTQRQRQALLEAETTVDRLVMLRHTLHEEMRAMRAIPSLPATEVARTSWCPN